ncbi:MAG: type I-F CRISPR-associated endonuclease Cas1 [Ottowia sp.]|nr:type I-F CRISPR-associated endonuclease Cas1 [Ottowia sp.]
MPTTGSKAKRQQNPRPVMLSKRANVFYLEHVRVMQLDERIVYATQDGALDHFFNIPERNTAFLLLGKGSSITDAAARRLAAANVMVGFCGSGGSPLFGAVDITFLAPQSEYRPTEYMQAWVKFWFDEEKRLEMGKRLLLLRLDYAQRQWEKNNDLKRAGVTFPHSHADTFRAAIAPAKDTQNLLLAEARWARALYAHLARAYKMNNFEREEGKGSNATREDICNGFLDHGNYIAYGYASVALCGLGVSFSLPLLHGKTRRGALVFDIADIAKDAIVMPLAFSSAARGAPSRDFRLALIETCQREELLDHLFDIVQTLAEKSK